MPKGVEVSSAADVLVAHPSPDLILPALDVVARVGHEVAVGDLVLELGVTPDGRGGQHEHQENQTRHDRHRGLVCRLLIGVQWR